MNYPETSNASSIEAAPGRCPASGLLLGLLKAARSVQDRLEAALEAIGLSGAKFQALDALVQAGKPLALSELAGCLKCVRSNVTQLADRLEADGLVRRVDDPSDRRAIRAVVTELGIERHASGAEAIAELQGWLDARVMPSDRGAVLRALAAID